DPDRRGRSAGRDRDGVGTQRAVARRWPRARARAAPAARCVEDVGAGGRGAGRGAQRRGGAQAPAPPRGLARYSLTLRMYVLSSGSPTFTFENTQTSSASATFDSLPGNLRPPASVQSDSL